MELSTALWVIHRLGKRAYFLIGASSNVNRVFERLFGATAEPDRAVMSHRRLTQLAEQASSDVLTPLDEVSLGAKQSTKDIRSASNVPGGSVRKWIPVSVKGDSLARRRWWILGAVCSVLVVLAISFLLVFTGKPPAEPAPVLPIAQAKPAVTGELMQSGATSLVISVVGKVRSPGLITVPAGSRVDDALRGAGGALPGTDLTTLNLARKLIDGEQLAVGIVILGSGSGNGNAEQGETGDALAPGGAGGKIHLNTATVAQFDSLPGVGEVTARRIVEWRRQHGGFTAIEQLREIDGIGESRFSQLRKQVVLP